MNMGVERAEAQPQDDLNGSVEEQSSAAYSQSSYFESIEEAPAPRSLWPALLAATLLILGLGWLGLVGWSLSRAWPGDSLSAWTGWAATASAPLVLLALVWLVFGRSSRRETEGFVRAVAAMRDESAALEQKLAIVAARLEENRSALTDEAARLMALGDEASDRLGRVTHYIARETAELERRAQALDQAAATARVDIGVLMSDLPRAEQQARAVAEAMKHAGLDAHTQAAALEGQLAAVTARSREADETIGGAAQRLGAHVARIETSTGAAAERIDEAAARMNAAVDGALTRASDSIERTRGALDEQGQAMLAMVEQGRAAFESAGEAAGVRLGGEVEQAGARIEWLAGRLAEQEQASRDLLAGLSERVAQLEGELTGLGASGESQGDRLTHAIAAVREQAEALQRQLEEGQSSSSRMIGSTQDMAEALGRVATQLRDELPPALATVREQASDAMTSAEAALAPVRAMQDAAGQAAASLGESEASLGRQREGVEALLARLTDGSAVAGEQLRLLAAAVAETDGAASRLAVETGPQLIDALVRVREAANQAATHAREAIAAAIPDSVAALAEASRDAFTDAVTEPVQDQLAEIAAAAQRATAVARQASERLTRQLLVIGETAAAIEDRIADDQSAREEKAAENLTRRVSLLIEALNSTAIDVGKILSNEVADTAWAAYLKGDRGVFTRRAVRLLDSGEAREIMRHYDEEPDFRDQVNRYVHDFETMLRRVLADRDGATLGVTLLSSDMGKLYVALAQAIERLRR